MAVLGSLAVPSLAMPASVRGTLGGADNKSAVASAMGHFGVTEADLRKVLAAALEKGGDYADLYFEHTFNNNVSLMDGKVNNCSANIDFGMGVRVLAGDQSGYAYVEGVTLDEMIRAARTAARIASSNKAGKTVALTEKTIAKNRYAVTTSWEETSVKDKIPYLEKRQDSPENAKLLGKLRLNKSVLSMKLEKLTRRLAELEGMTPDLQTCRLRCGTVYPVTNVTIGNASRAVNNVWVNCMAYYDMDNRDVVFT